MEKAKTRKIKKWDEIHGEYEVEVSEDMGGGSPEEAAGAGPSISRNPMKGIEDMVEQSKQVTPPIPVLERKSVPGCCFEREITGWQDSESKGSE